MRTPTRIPGRPYNPYEELAELAGPEPPHDPWPAAGEQQETDDDEPWSPPDHRRRKRPDRRRRASRRTSRRKPRPSRPYRTATKLLIALAASAAIAVLADRCAVMYAEKQAQRKLQQELHLAAEPQVDIHGFPFLTQVLAKRLDRVDVTVPHVAADRVTLARVQASARGIRLTGDLPAGVRGAVVGRLRGDVLLSFDDMKRELAASQLKFTDQGGNVVAANGRLDVAGQEVRLHAQAHIRRDDDGRGVSTGIDGMSLDLPGIAVYRPGREKSLTLHRETAERISRDAARAKALLSVPALAERLGVTPSEVALALRSEDRLHELTGAPRFVEALTRANLVDVVIDHPWLLEKAGIDPKVVAGLAHLRPPSLTAGLSLSFRLPEQARDLRLNGVTVERDGIHAELSGTGLPIGEAN
ncbi:DUF2993 domain-containing protein [Streptomyces sp. NPDC049577]|uniref:LmeA family phospholipid-binding protein n=1 Tax=Streptomyces sp. NPDC049577 TaxID=3155153 RepID=UPI0034363A00